MPNTYQPDKWTIIGDGKDFKVFGSWSGGYLDGDSWRLSSGLQRVEQDPEDENYLLMHNWSGSIYRCHKEGEGANFYGASVLASWGDAVKRYTLEEFNAIAGDGNEEEAPEPAGV